MLPPPHQSYKSHCNAKVLYFEYELRPLSNAGIWPQQKARPAQRSGFLSRGSQSTLWIASSGRLSR